MIDFAHRVRSIALPLCLLAGCSHNSRLSNSAPLDTQGANFAKLNPGMNFVTFTSFADGKLILENGCFRLLKKQSSLAIIWPETAMMVRARHTVHIEDHAARWSANLGDSIRLGGKESDNISAVDLNNNAVRDCAGPYFVASNVIRRGLLF